MTDPQENVESSGGYDPVYLNCRREAVIILVAWAVCLAWTVGYCHTFGYGLTPEEVTVVAGIPSWVFWGVMVPWMLAAAFSCWFSLWYMADDDLGEEQPQPVGDTSDE